MGRYYEQAEQLLSDVKNKKLFLHSCCAPCSSSVLEFLMPKIATTVFYYNPCIMPYGEYEHRLNEQKRLCDILGVPLTVGDYDNDEYLKVVKDLFSAPEGGARCELCFYMRLKETAIRAKKGGYDYFCTTLTVSPHKNADVINSIGNSVASEVGVEFLPSDFKKKNGYLRSIQLSKRYGLYRQEYCGCRLQNND